MPEPKQGKATSAQLNDNKDLEVDMKKEEPSFFGSFFRSSNGPAGNGGSKYFLLRFKHGHIQSSVHKPR